MTRPIKTDRNDRINRLLVHPVAKLAVPLVISVVALFVLHRLASEFSWQEVKLEMTGAPKRALLAAVCLTIVSFAALALYDVLAVEIVAKGKVPRRVAAMTGAAGAAITNFLGASWLTGSSLRFRVYSAQGLDWTSIAGILATAWFATLLGMAFVTGFAMVVRPMGIGTVFGLAPNAETAFGVAVLIAIAGLFIWLSLGRRTITFRDFRMTLASPRLAAMQIGIVTVDILAASLVLYVLMPADLTQNFGFFLVVYLAAIGGGLLSHAPGLTTFTLDGPKRKDFRYAQRRARREGYVFEVVAAADLAPILPELRGVSQSWLASKHGREKGFSLGSFDEGYLSHFDHAILRKAENGAIIAFANLFQGADHNELSFDLMRHVTAAPGFVMDALFAEILLWGKAQGFRWFSLGATPFAGLEDHPLATTWNRFGSFIYQHGERFYNFEGLRSFKEKFDPEWTPTYLVSPRGLQTPRVLYDVNLLVSGGVRGLALEAKNDD